MGKPSLFSNFHIETISNDSSCSPDWGKKISTLLLNIPFYAVCALVKLISMRVLQAELYNTIIQCICKENCKRMRNIRKKTFWNLEVATLIKLARLWAGELIRSLSRKKFFREGQVLNFCFSWSSVFPSLLWKGYSSDRG